VSSTEGASAPAAGRDIGRLLVSCPDRPGIVAAITTVLAAHGANIVESQQHSTDPSGGRFYLRQEFVLPGLPGRIEALRADLGRVGDEFELQWRVATGDRVPRMAIFVSRTDHVLQELLWRTRAGDLTADIRLIASNHPDLEPLAKSFDIPFHHVPAAATRGESERRLLDLVVDQVDLIVLARYMQILTPVFLDGFGGPIINIHHSFLPAFVGADPYRAAYERGVKLIGATAHYVTAELDAGPIIDQDVHRVDHAHAVEDLRRVGRLVERNVLARAVGWHLADRVLLHGNKTIVFPGP
jgi:formyltetrahydrofolate deformylase